MAISVPPILISYDWINPCCYRSCSRSVAAFIASYFLGKFPPCPQSLLRRVPELPPEFPEGGSGCVTSLFPKDWRYRDNHITQVIREAHMRWWAWKLKLRGLDKYGWQSNNSVSLYSRICVCLSFLLWLPLATTIPWLQNKATQAHLWYQSRYTNLGRKMKVFLKCLLKSWPQTWTWSHSYWKTIVGMGKLLFSWQIPNCMVWAFWKQLALECPLVSSLKSTGEEAGWWKSGQ